jgi:hypothetical protein
MLRKSILAAAIIAIVVALTGAASAQFPMTGISLNGGPKQLTPEEQARQKAIDDAYKTASKKIPDKKVDDPWGTVRPNPSTATNSR